MPLIHIKNQNVCLFSATQVKHRSVIIPDNVQIIIDCGNICNGRNEEENCDFFKWYSGLEIPNKIFVNVNHDLPFGLEPDLAKKIIPK